MKTKKRVLAMSALMAALLLVSLSLPARERKGARVVVEQNDGANVSGELLMVKRDGLVVAGRVGGVIVNLNDVRSVRIVKKSKAGTGLLLGLVGGTVIGYVLGRESPGCQDSWMTVSLSTLFIGLPCAGLGALAGLAQGKDSILNMNEANRKILVSKLNRYARVPDLSPGLD